MRTIVWFRGKDLRLADHAPLRAALEGGGDVIPLFVLDPYFFAPRRVRERWPHRMQFLLDSLRELAQGIEERGSKLVLVEGKSVDVVPRLVREWKADRVVAHRWVEPVGRARDARIAGLELYEGETLVPPGTVRNRQGQPFKVFTPFSRAWHEALVVSAPLPAPKRLPPLPLRVRSARLPSFPRNERLQRGGERAAQARLAAFLKRGGESRLSADLKFGTLSVRTAWARAQKHPRFLNELVWRELAYSTLWDFPYVLERPFKDAWSGFPWRKDEAGFRAWCEGRTGYPQVDAAMRALRETGFMPNRARMICASFLTKHLMIDYRLGEAHFLKWLTDGDWANNNLNWQWCAGCGVDAAPYFRIFNPGPPKGTPVVEHRFARERFLGAAKAWLNRTGAARSPSRSPSRASRTA